MQDLKFVLVTEKRPNSFEPIYWTNNSLYNLRNIDNFTSKFNEEVFRKVLVDNSLLAKEDEEAPFQIIYNDNGIRKLKSGVFFKEDYSDNIFRYIISFIKDNYNNKELLNNLYQKVHSDKIISNNSKNIIYNVFANRQFDLNEDILNTLNQSDYVDIRNIYYYIRKELEPKLNKKRVLSKSEDEN